MLANCPISKAHDGNYICMFIGKQIGKKFDYPKRILTDCSKEFVSKDTWAYLLDRNVQLITTTPYHPQANGCVEQLNGVLLLALRKLSSEDPLSWPKHLPTALLMARSRVIRDIHFSPFEMVYGYKPEIQELPNSLKLIEPEFFPQGNKVSPELLAIQSKASEQ